MKEVLLIEYLFLGGTVFMKIKQNDPAFLKTLA
jgi:hypothetical protein